jgi:hypothetical protein
MPDVPGGPQCVNGSSRSHHCRLIGYCCFGAPARVGGAEEEPGTLDVGYGLGARSDGSRTWPSLRGRHSRVRARAIRPRATSALRPRLERAVQEVRREARLCRRVSRAERRGSLRRHGPPRSGLLRVRAAEMLIPPVCGTPPRRCCRPDRARRPRSSGGGRSPGRPARRCPYRPPPARLRGRRRRSHDRRP